MTNDHTRLLLDSTHKLMHLHMFKSYSKWKNSAFIDILFFMWDRVLELPFQASANQMSSFRWYCIIHLSQTKSADLCTCFRLRIYKTSAEKGLPYIIAPTEFSNLPKSWSLTRTYEGKAAFVKRCPLTSLTCVEYSNCSRVL